MSWQLVFADDFNRANSNIVGNGWTQSVDSGLNHTYGVNNQQLLSQATSSNRNLSIRRSGPSGLASHRVSTDIVAFSNGSTDSRYNQVGLFVGSDTNPTGIYAGYRAAVAFNGRIELYVRPAGQAPTLLAAVNNVGLQLPVAAALSRVGSSLSVSVNGVEVLTAPDSTFNELTHYGGYVWSQNGAVRADNFALSEFSSAPPEPPATFRPRRQRMAALGGF